MELEHYFRFSIIARTTELTNANIRSLFDRLSRFPHSPIPKPIENLASLPPVGEYRMEGGLGFYANDVELTLDGTMSASLRKELKPPPGYDIVFLDAPDWTLVDMPDQFDALAEVLKEIVVGLKAIYAVGICSDYYDELGYDMDNVLDTPGGIQFISQEVLDRVDISDSPLPEDHDDLAGGIWLRYDEDYFYGMAPGYRDGFSSLLPHLKQAVLDVLSNEIAINGTDE